MSADNQSGDDVENGNDVDPGTWTKVASGDIGDMIYWKPGFEALGKVRSILSQLEEVGKENVDWKSLIGEHSYFEILEHSNFPPLYNFRDFETWEDFLAIVKEPEPTGEMPFGPQFNSLDLYVGNDEKERVIQEFTNFLQHLKTLKPLRDAGIV
jgi:hypothetical protein